MSDVYLVGVALELEADSSDQATRHVETLLEWLTRRGDLRAGYVADTTLFRRVTEFQQAPAPTTENGEPNV